MLIIILIKQSELQKVRLFEFAKVKIISLASGADALFFKVFWKEMKNQARVLIMPDDALKMDSN